MSVVEDKMPVGELMKSVETYRKENLGVLDLASFFSAFVKVNSELCAIRGDLDALSKRISKVVAGVGTLRQGLTDDIIGKPKQQ